MSQSKNIFIISLGQLIPPDPQKSIDAFAELVANQSGFPYFAKARVFFAWILDKLWYGTIDSYKKGNLEFGVFERRLCKQLGINYKSGAVLKAWNAMCAIQKDTTEKIKELFDLQKELGFILVIITSSNAKHFELLEKQISQLLDPNNLTPITTSFEKHTTSISELAQIAVQNTNYDQKTYNIISLHRDIRSSADIGIKNASFSCHPTLSVDLLGRIKEFYTTNELDQSQPMPQRKIQKSQNIEKSTPDPEANGRKLSTRGKHKDKPCLIM